MSWQLAILLLQAIICLLVYTNFPQDPFALGPFCLLLPFMFTITTTYYSIYVAYYLGGGGGYSHIKAIWVCATVKDMVFKQFSLGQGIEIRGFWSRIGYHLPGN